jgi:hypothetical protein
LSRFVSRIKVSQSNSHEPNGIGPCLPG